MFTQKPGPRSSTQWSLAAGSSTGLGAACRPASFLAGRYRLERLLGEGAHKRVYLAWDSRLDRRVAVAMIKTEGLSDALAERVRREARTMARLPQHSGLVTVYDAGEEGGCPYIVQEYLDGGTVADLLERAGGRPLALKQVLRIGSDLCGALDHIHRHAIVHRDLKPENVWLTADGAAKLGDFGLQITLREARSATIAKLTADGVMVGTIAYMPPEQALGNPVSPQSDLYALGAMLYEMVTGDPPFVGDDALSIVSQHVRTPPVAPARRNPDVPAALNDLVLALLAKAPRQRPASAGAVRATLDGIGATLRPRRGSHGSGSRALDALTSEVYVGRESETDELCAAADAAAAGSGQIVTVAGEPGIGKTRLAEQLTTYAQLRGATVLWGRCYDGEGAPPYWPWVQVIRAYAAKHDPDLLVSMMGVGASDIAQTVSDVRRLLPDLPVPPSLRTDQARFRLFDSVTTFLGNASCREPLIVVLDDLHHADRPSLMLLQFLAQELAGTRLLVVGTYRDTDVHPGHPLIRTLSHLARARPLRRILLGGLTRGEVRRYVHLTTGIEPDDALIARLHNKSEGNPFFVVEMVRLLARTDRLRLRDPAEATIVVPDEVRDLIGRQLERLSTPCRETLCAAALIGRDFDVSAVQDVTRVTRARVLQALGEATTERVITRTGPGRYRFSHVLFADTLADVLPPPEHVAGSSTVGGKRRLVGLRKPASVRRARERRRHGAAALDGPSRHTESTEHLVALL